MIEHGDKTRKGNKAAVFALAVVAAMTLTVALFLFLHKGEKQIPSASPSRVVIMPGLRYSVSKSEKGEVSKSWCLVYDLLDASHEDRLLALLAYLHQLREQEVEGEVNEVRWTFLLLLPNSSSLLPPAPSTTYSTNDSFSMWSFCQQNGSRPSVCRVYRKPQLATRAASLSMLTEAIVTQLDDARDIGALFYLSSAWLGPFLPSSLPPTSTYDVFQSFFQFLRPEKPLVVSHLFVTYDQSGQKLSLSLQSRGEVGSESGGGEVEESLLPPLAMTGDLVRAVYLLFQESPLSRSLLEQEQRGASESESVWVISNLLASGLSLQVLDPSQKEVDWLKVYRLCHNLSLRSGSASHFAINTAASRALLEDHAMTSHRSSSSFSSLTNECQSFVQELLEEQQRTKTLEEKTTKIQHHALFELAKPPRRRLRFLKEENEPLERVGIANSHEKVTDIFRKKMTGQNMRNSKKKLMMKEKERQGMSAADKKKDNGKTLVIYVYYEGSAMAQSNLLYFLRNGVQRSHLVDYVIIVQGQTSLRILSALSNFSSFSPTINSSSSATLRGSDGTAQLQWRYHNLQVLYHTNTCFDIGTWGQLLTYLYQTTQFALRYRYFIVLNSSIRGPYLPPVWPSSQSHMWPTALTSKLSESVKLVGLAVNCPDGQGRKIPHVMSMVLAFDQKTVEIWMMHQQQQQDAPFSRPFAAEERKKKRNNNRKRGVTMLGDVYTGRTLPSTYENISKVLYCAQAKEQSYMQESELSLAVLAAGYEITSMQPYYNQSWRGYWLDISEKNHPFELARGKYWTCPGVQLDIFYQAGWDKDGRNPHPWSYLFVKTNRGIYGTTVSEIRKQLDQLSLPPSLSAPLSASVDSSLLNRQQSFHNALIDPEQERQRQEEAEKESVVWVPSDSTSSLPLALHAPRYYQYRNILPSLHIAKQRHCVLFTHNLNYEGAPIWLLRIAPILQAEGYVVKIFSLSPGPLGEAFEKANVEVIKLSSIPPAPSVHAKEPVFFYTWMVTFYERLEEEYNFSPCLYIFNTVLFIRYVMSMPFLFKTAKVHSVWALHEGELYQAVRNPNGFSFDREFPELTVPGLAYAAPDRVLFVSDSARERASRFDSGQFVTIRGFIPSDSCPWLISESQDSSEEEMKRMRQEGRERARRALNISSDAYVITNIGSICRRKQQHWLVDLYMKLARDNKYSKGGRQSFTIRNRPLYVLLIGYSGGDTSPAHSYEQDLVKQVKAAGLEHHILFVNKTDDPFFFALAADLHTSLSTHESFPLNTLEAMCYGIPIMATPAFGVREQIIRPGTDGVLLPSTTNFDVFYFAFQSFFGVGMKKGDGEQQLHGLWRKIGLEGSRTLRRYFTEKVTAPYFHKLLKDVFQTSEEVKEKEKEVETRKSRDKVCIVMRIQGKQVDKGLSSSSKQFEDFSSKAKGRAIHGSKSNADNFNNEHRFFNVEETIRSLYAQEHTNWELLLLPSDKSDYDRLFPLLVQYNHYNALSGDDDSQKGHMHFHRNVKGKSSMYSNINRIRVITYHDELRTYHAKEYAGFHQHLYHLTDRAISQCSPDSDWLLVTNGDNTYHRDFLNHLDRSYDLIAYDFYSRWFLHLKTPLPPCDRLMISPEYNEYWEEDKESFSSDQLYYNHSLPFKKNHEKVLNAIGCKRNELRRYGTDLGANVLNLRRWRAEGHRFGLVQADDASQDGIMMERLISPPYDWKVKHVHAPKEVHHQCLYSHNPNYHACLKLGAEMRWDDSKHRCVTLEELLTNKIPFKETKLRGCIRT
eukprot:gene6782-7493_t